MWSIYYSYKEIAVLQLFEYRCPGFRKISSFDRNNCGITRHSQYFFACEFSAAFGPRENKKWEKERVSFSATIWSPFFEGDTKSCATLVLYGPLCWIHVHRSQCACTPRHICNLVECTGRKRAHNGGWEIHSVLSLLPRRCSLPSSSSTAAVAFPRFHPSNIPPF